VAWPTLRLADTAALQLRPQIPCTQGRQAHIATVIAHQRRRARHDQVCAEEVPKIKRIGAREVLCDSVAVEIWKAEIEIHQPLCGGARCEVVGLAEKLIKRRSERQVKLNIVLQGELCVEVCIARTSSFAGAVWDTVRRRARRRLRWRSQQMSKDITRGLCDRSHRSNGPRDAPRYGAMARGGSCRRFEHSR
jgi:hypothetical protein